MNRIKSLFVLFISILAGISTVLAQQNVYDLRKCVDLAVENNISLKMSKLGVEMQRNNYTQSRASLLPTFNANASHGYNWGQTVDLYTNQFASERVQTNNFYIQSGVTVFNGFRLLNLVNQQSLELRAKMYDCDKTRNDIMLNVATAYLQVLYCTEQLNIAQGQSDITKQQISRMEQFVDNGLRSKDELLLLEAQLASEMVTTVKAKSALDIANLTLSQIMNIPDETDFVIVKPDLGSPESTPVMLMDPQDIFLYANDHLPQIKSAEVMVKSSEAGLKAAKGAVYPSLHLSASMGTGFSGARKDYNYTLSGFEPNGMFTSSLDTVYAPVFDVSEKLRPFGDQINDNFNQSVALYLTIPLFNGLQTRTSVKNAELMAMNAQYSLELQKQQLMQEIQQAHADAAAALTSYLATKKSFEAMKESFSYAEEKYNIGLMSSTDYHDAKNRLMSAESQMLVARFELVFKSKLLDFYMGREIYF
jgi:outer membrane protein